MKREELLRLLSFAPDSADADAMRRDADALSRERFGGRALVLGQIGVESRACPGKCAFCTFSADRFPEAGGELPAAELIRKSVAFATSGGGLDALFLMTMHDFDQEELLHKIALVRAAVPQNIRLVLNVGDCDASFWEKSRRAGVSGAYHVLRLREGKDTAIPPERRRRTIEAVRRADLDWYYCCEPLGPEHENDEIADAILLGNEFGCFQHAAMARVNFPGSPMQGEISRARLSQIVAAVTLASAENRFLGSIAVHEPDESSLRAGANSLYAEMGANPRDTAADTAKGRGRTVSDIRKMLKEADWK